MQINKIHSISNSSASTLRKTWLWHCAQPSIRQKASTVKGKAIFVTIDLCMHLTHHHDSNEDFARTQRRHTHCSFAS